MFQTNQKAQAGLEYLMTYGWAIVLIAAVLGVLVFIVSSPASDVTFSSSDPTKILMKAGSASDTTTEIKMQNITGGKIEITSVSLPNGYSPANCSLNDETDTSLITDSNPVLVTAGGEINIECTNVSDASGTISIDYTDYAGLPRSVAITASGTAASGPNGPIDYIAYYSFNEGSGTTAVDSAGTNDGTLTNFDPCATLDCNASSGWVSTGHSGNAISFDGLDDYVQVSSSFEELHVNNILQNVTVSLWINSASISEVQWKGILQFNNTPLAGNGSLEIFTDGEENYGVYTRAKNTQFYISSKSIISTWTHVVYANDGTNDFVYEDGVLVYQEAQGTDTTGAHNNLYIGSGYDGYFNGQIDNVKIYDRALSPSEVCALCGVGCSC